MSDSIRIRTTPNGSDKYLKVNLQQDFNFIEILSLKISQEDAYRKFCSDYGVIVGRVIINNGFGVPNAKVSVFIPLDDVDKNNPEIKGLYPFEVITDKDSEGIRYNLLPKNGDPTNICSTPVGTFPNKREVLDNTTMLEVYCKYYKFTTTTNHAGDFMLFGIPLGTYTVHIDADISDIGIASQRPYDLISQGTPVKLFDSPTKFKSDKNLDKLVQVKTMNAGVNVQPFWGDTENCEIGITRLDFDLNYSLTPSAIFMGSIFGDQDKHSINKHCNPRKKLGNLCEQVTGPGSVDMIRKTLDGQIEEFSVNGGRVIDDNGTWAYQIPMNLDYVITDEEGNLIPSQDPNKGIPTRARVGFRIGMDETGGEGRLRTRAKFLIPNNPLDGEDDDYTFGQETKDESFRDIYWNKIYSVSNYISRFQKLLHFPPILSESKTRRFIGIKEVDDCGDKTPFPYNRAKTTVNPLFVIMCLIIKIIVFIVLSINVVFSILNRIFKKLNDFFDLICGFFDDIINVINKVGGNLKNINCPSIPYIPYITVECDEAFYAPGADESSDQYTNQGLEKGYGGSNSGLDDCLAFQIADSLDVFKFDFYNDWINGTLFGFLLKYKKKRSIKGNGGAEKFCEYDCDDFPNGVDSNNNGKPDNNCQNNLLLDTCFPNGDDSQDFSASNYPGTRDGLIKKLGDEFYYAARTHDKVYKLFASDLISLGSVFDCDWQGIPKIQKFLIPTTYKLPPDTQDVDDNGNILTSGMINTKSPELGEIFSINCIGVHMDSKQVLNVRHLCEIGVEIDQSYESGGSIVSADSIISVDEIDDDNGKFVRDVFYGLNNSLTPQNIPVNGFSTNFNINVSPIYDFTSTSDNGEDYINFRGYNGGSGGFGQTKHSYYFYFGLLPGKTALDKMNQSFFTTCNLILKDDLLIESSTTPDLYKNNGGSITFSFIGGKGPFSYTIDGIDGTSFSTSGVVSASNIDTKIENLLYGTYFISALDSLKTPITRTIVVSGPTPLYAFVSVTKNATTIGSQDGEITISFVNGGTPSYSYELKNIAGLTIYGPAPALSNTKLSVISGDYILTIRDAVGGIVNNNLKVSGIPSLIVIPTITNTTCFNGNDGKLLLDISGGQKPYNVRTTGPNGYISTSRVLNDLIYGTYITTIIDNINSSVVLTSVVSSNSKLVLKSASQDELNKQCNPQEYQIPFYYLGGGTVDQEAGIIPLDIEYELEDANGNSNGVTRTTILIPQTPSTTPMILKISSNERFDRILIRSLNIEKTCLSESIWVGESYISLPQTELTGVLTKISQDNMIDFRLDFSGGKGTVHLDENLFTTITSPYTINRGMYFGQLTSYSVIITDSSGCAKTILWTI